MNMLFRHELALAVSIAIVLFSLGVKKVCSHEVHAQGQAIGWRGIDELDRAIETERDLVRRSDLRRQRAAILRATSFEPVKVSQSIRAAREVVERSLPSQER